MSYYGLARAAAGAFVRGAAGSLGRRVGGYRRRRRVRWPKPRNRATNVKRTRSFVKRTRREGGTRNVRRLWRAVRALQRTSDPDVSFRDIASSEFSLANEVEGFARAVQQSFVTTMTNNLSVGNQYKVKSLNQQLTIRLGNKAQVDNPILLPDSFARNLRVVYVLFKDEPPPNALPAIMTGWSSVSAQDTIWQSSGDTIYPPFVKNPGYTYRILYDRTYKVRSGVATQLNIVLPGSVFYDKGQIKFRETGINNTLVQQNNFLYRLLIADSITTPQYTGTITTNIFGLFFTSQSRWKYYDNGGTQIASTLALTKVSEPSAEETDAAGDGVNG